MGTSLTRRTKSGGVLQRPPEIEAEIKSVLLLGLDEVLRRAAIVDPTADGYLPSECLVHLIRQDRRSGGTQLINELVPILLQRCTKNLRKKVYGFSEQLRDKIVDEVLARFIDLLLDNGDLADYFEVKFAQAFLRLRIDVVRRYSPHRLPQEDTHVEADGDVRPSGVVPHPAQSSVWLSNPVENAYFISEVLQRLTEEEREIFLLRHMSRIPINATKHGQHSLVELMRLSERTIRNRLRSAEAKIKALVEEGQNEHGRSDDGRSTGHPAGVC